LPEKKLTSNEKSILAGLDLYQNDLNVNFYAETDDFVYAYNSGAIMFLLLFDKNHKVEKNQSI
jgi:hypothetical protein